MNIDTLSLRQHGVERVCGVLSQEQIHTIIEEVSTVDEAMPKHGIRHADKKFASIKALVESDYLLDHARRVLGAEPARVRVIFFDKTPEKNWLVTWHQDKTIAVTEQRMINGWGPWTLKDGVHHVQPALEVLDQMITFRLHLDDTGADNGCLKVIPASHQQGILSQSDIYRVVEQQPIVLCDAAAGDMLMMRPHILHASSKSEVPEHRRIVHIEYSSYVLPQGLDWG